MHSVSLNVDCAEWACRTKVLTSTAAYAPLSVHHRNLQRVGISGIFSLMTLLMVVEVPSFQVIFRPLPSEAT